MFLVFETILNDMISPNEPNEMENNVPSPQQCGFHFTRILAAKIDEKFVNYNHKLTDILERLSCVSLALKSFFFLFFLVF